MVWGWGRGQLCLYVRAINDCNWHNLMIWRNNFRPIITETFCITKTLVDKFTKLHPIAMLIREILLPRFATRCVYIYVRDKAVWGTGKVGLIGLLEILLSFIRLPTKVNREWSHNSELKSSALLTWMKIKTSLFLFSLDTRCH